MADLTQVELQHLYNRQLNICHNRFCMKIYPSFFLLLLFFSYQKLEINLDKA